MTKYRSVGACLLELRESPHIDLRCELEEVFYGRLGDPFFLEEELLYFACRQDERKEEV